jgi:hypothetical protein
MAAAYNKLNRICWHGMLLTASLIIQVIMQQDWRACLQGPAVSLCCAVYHVSVTKFLLPRLLTAACSGAGRCGAAGPPLLLQLHVLRGAASACSS